MTWFRRKPIIYDLWADIRLYWSALTYYEKAWAEKMKLIPQFYGRGLPKMIELYLYEPNLFGGGQ